MASMVVDLQVKLSQIPQVTIPPKISPFIQQLTTTIRIPWMSICEPLRWVEGSHSLHLSIWHCRL